MQAETIKIGEIVFEAAPDAEHRLKQVIAFLLEPSGQQVDQANAGSLAPQKNEKDGDRSSKLVTVKELAQILQVPVSWIYDRTRQGPKAIPFVKVGKYIRFDPEEVVRFFRQKEGGGVDGVYNK